MKVNIEFYGRLKTQFSQQSIEWHSEQSTVEAIYRELCNHFNQEINLRVIKPILNDTFCDWQQVINNNDVIGLFPPASGG